MDRSEYEIIVVDDGSTDNSYDVALAYNDYIKLYTLPDCRGVAYASNYGIAKATNPFIIRVDADDYINRNALLFMSEILNWNQNIGFVYCDNLVVDENEKIMERIFLDNVNNIFRHGAGVMFRKSYLEAIGLYNEDIKNAEDFDLIARYFRNFDGYYLRIPLYRYFKHNGSLSHCEDRRIWVRTIQSKYGFSEVNP